MTLKTESSAHEQCVIVTAGASGIGLAIARAFADAGAIVFICDVDREALDAAILADPRLSGGYADIANPSDVETFFQETIGELGRIDVLVNNAGISGPAGPIDETNCSDWERTVGVNLNGPFYCVRQAALVMKRQGGGSIINISTTSARTGLPERSAYVATKCGLEALSANLARELGPFNIRSNVIQPGKVDNPRGLALTRKYAQANGLSFDDAETERLQFVSMRTRVMPTEIADLAVILASDACRHITGQKISVDGNVEWEG